MNPLSSEFRPSGKSRYNTPLLGRPRNATFAEQLLGNASHVTVPGPTQNTATRFSFPANNYINQSGNVDNYRGHRNSHIGFIPSHDGFGHQLQDVPKYDQDSLVNGTQELFCKSETETGMKPPSSRPWRDDLSNHALYSRQGMQKESVYSMTEQKYLDNLKRQTKFDSNPRQEPHQTILPASNYPGSVSGAGKGVVVDKTLASFSSPSPWTWGQHDRILAKSSANNIQEMPESWMPVKRTLNQMSARENIMKLLDEHFQEANEETTDPSVETASTFGKKTPRVYRVTVDGIAYDLKSGMVPDQFGMLALLYLIKSSKNNSSGALLLDGLSRDDFPTHKNDRIFDVFCNPWSYISHRPQDIDRNIPNEYLTNAYIKQKLPPIKLARYTEDLLFYLFYVYGGDSIQVAAAYQLYQREWRYHKTEQVWLERIPGISPVTIMDSWEQGTYFYFDVVTWRKHPKPFRIEYNQLEEKPKFFSNQ